MPELVILLKVIVYMFSKSYSKRQLRNICSYGSLTEDSDRKSRQISEFSPQHHSTVFSEDPFKCIIKRHQNSID